jgi:hypothetical protein
MIAGEMGRSVWKYPTEYMRLVSKYRGALSRGKQGGNVKVGIALHWNKVCGNCFNVLQGATATQYNSSYAKVSPGWGADHQYRLHGPCWRCCTLALCATVAYVVSGPHKGTSKQCED